MPSMNARQYSLTSSLTFKGQVTIPIEIRRALGLRRGDRVAFVQEGETVTLTPAQSIAERTAGILARYRHESPAPPAQERAAAEIAWAEDVVRRSGG